MTQAAATVAMDALGSRVEGAPYPVTRAEIIAFAAATNDDTPAFREGRLAPPIYALNPVMAAMVAAKKRAVPQFAFHGEHDIVFHRPLVPGMTIRAVAEVIGIHARSTGVTVTTRIESRCDGELVNEQHFVSFAPGARIAGDCGRAAPAHELLAEDRVSAPLAELDYPFDADQTLRYAHASHDYDAYTLDPAVARSMGFPAILVHGMCTVAFSSRAVIASLCREAPERLRRLAVRLSRPVYLVPGQRVVTTVWRKAGTAEAYVFIARNIAGETVLTNGLAEVEP